MRYVMFLRGINVGGVKVPMAGLRDALSALGLRDVTTYLQTGNVLFESDEPGGALKGLIEEKLSALFNYPAIVLIYPAAVLSEVIDEYPFAYKQGYHRYAIFCEDEAVISELMTHRSELDSTVEDIAGGKHVVYWTVPVGSTLGTPFSKLMAKPAYRSFTTNRNLNTLEKMI